MRLSITKKTAKMTKEQIQENIFKSSVSDTHRKFISQFNRKEIQRRFEEVYVQFPELFNTDSTIEVLLKRRTENICIMYGYAMGEQTIRGIKNYCK